MSLEEFLKDCKKTGYIPVSYRCDTITSDGRKLKGKQYVNPEYAHLLKDKKSKSEDHGRAEIAEGPAGYLDIKDSIMALKGENVVVHSADGYHYGRLIDFDGKKFTFGKYYFDKDMLDYFNYNNKAFFRKDSVVPAKGLISIARIPMIVDN